MKAVLGRHTALCKLKGGWWRRGHGGQRRGHRQQWRAWYELMQYRNTKVALHPLKRIGEFERDTVGSGQVRFLLSKVCHHVQSSEKTTSVSKLAQTAPNS